MIRPELIVAGCVLVVIGILLCVVGYQKTQPTPGDQIVGFLEKLSGESAPREFKTDKTLGYLSYGAGGTCLIAGLVLIVKSRPAQAS